MPRKNAPDLRHITAEELRPLALPLSSLTTDPANERVHDRKGIDRKKYSLLELGMRSPLSVREESGKILVTTGNGILEALRELAEERAVGRWKGAPKGPLAWLHAPVCEFADDKATAAKHRLLDNAAGRDSRDDPEAVQETIAKWPEVDWAAGGWGDSDLERARESWADIPTFGDQPSGGGDGGGDGGDGSGDDPPIPDPPVDPVTQPGDIWVMGDHRLICGSCRDPEVVARLLDGEKINVGFTSPPYASQRKYDESSGFKPIKPDEYVEWFEAVQANVRTHLADDGSWFVNIKEHCDDGERHLYVKDLAIAHKRAWGWRFVDELCWRRVSITGRYPNRFKNGFEPVFHFATAMAIKFDPCSVAHASEYCVGEDDPRHEAKGDERDHYNAVSGQSVGMALPSNVLDASFGGTRVNHSAAFPIALPTFFIKAYSDEGDIIFDPFDGSGTTIIAAEREDRRGYGCEISPKYCDVTVTRWETETGRKAQRFDVHGVEFEGIARAS